MSGTLDDPRIVRGMTAQLQRLRSVLGPGERALGWKLGFGSTEAMASLGTRDPLVGFLPPAARVESGGRVDVEGWGNPIAEPEIAVHLGRDLPPGADPAAVAAAIAGLGPAIEVVDVFPPPREVEEILTGDLYQRGVVLGPPDPTRAGGSVEGLTGRVTVNGREIAVTDQVTAATGDLLSLLQHAADLLGGSGARLEAGQVVIAGSIIPPLSVRPGQRVRFALEPIGAIDVGFADHDPGAEPVPAG